MTTAKTAIPYSEFQSITERAKQLVVFKLIEHDDANRQSTCIAITADGKQTKASMPWPRMPLTVDGVPARERIDRAVEESAYAQLTLVYMSERGYAADAEIDMSA